MNAKQEQQQHLARAMLKLREAINAPPPPVLELSWWDRQRQRFPRVTALLSDPLGLVTSVGIVAAIAADSPWVPLDVWIGLGVVAILIRARR